MNKQKNRPIKIKSQTGITFWSFLFTGSVVIFLMYIGALLVPVYTADNAIGKALTAAVDSTPAQELRVKSLVHKIDQKLYIDGVYDGPNLTESLNVLKGRDGLKVSLNYRKEIPLFYNIGMHLDFTHEETK